ncbi:MAG: hypothetical protein QXQ41_04785 [Candidatus Bathyarchaeia archaeon]
MGGWHYWLPQHCRHKIELAARRIEGQIRYLNGAISLLTRRNEVLFQKVDAYSKHDMKRANVYANELAEIRTMASGVRAIFQALIVIPVASLIGVRFTPNILCFILALLIIFVSSGLRGNINPYSFIHEDQGEVYEYRAGANDAAILHKQRIILHRDNALGNAVHSALQPNELYRGRR